MRRLNDQGRHLRRLKGVLGALLLIGAGFLAVAPGAGSVLGLTEPRQVDTLWHFDVGEDAELGASVDFDGDRAVVGAPGDEHAFSSPGKVWVFDQRFDEGFNYAAFLVPEDGNTGDRFGASVAVEGDTVVVGAPGADAVYVFHQRPVLGWVQAAVLEGASGSGFGASVVLEGSTIVVGAPSSDVFEKRAGAVFAFAGQERVWASVGVLGPLDPEPGMGLGESLALDASVLAVGAPKASVGGASEAGAVFVFAGAGGMFSPVPVAEVTAPSGLVEASAWFGESVDVEGETLLVGAPREDAGGVFQAGAGHVFLGGGASWVHVEHLVAGEGASNAWLGASVALGSGQAVLGAPLVGIDEGEALVFEHTTVGAWQETAAFKAFETSVEDRFGSSLVFEEGTVLVGAPFAGEEDTGEAYAFSLTA